jgi:hypothetical protein
MHRFLDMISIDQRVYNLLLLELDVAPEERLV